MKGKKIPGPKNIVFSKELRLIKDQPLQFLEYLNKNFPGITQIKALHLNIVFITDPKYIRCVLQTNQKHYVKSAIYNKLKLILGDGLVTSEGDLWKRQRKLIQPSFHKQTIYNLFDTMLSSTNEMISEWKEVAKKDGKLDFSEEMMQVTLDIISKTMLGAEVKSDAKIVRNSLHYIGNQVNVKTKRLIDFPLWIPTSSNIKFKKERKVLDDIIYKIINTRKKEGNNKGDLLDMLMLSKYEDTGETMPPKLLRDEIMTVFTAGHSTTANALTWTFYLISQYPEVFKKLKKEVDDVVGKGEITFQHLQQLKYTKACFNESMRLFPPVWIFGRKALEDNWMGDYLIKKGTNVLISPYIVHRSSEFWKNADTFDPDRWETEEVKEMDKYVYFPFAAGPRMCIGNNFALFEADIIITKVIQNFDFEYAGAAPPEVYPSTILRVKDGLPMKIVVSD